jgi:Ca2+/H+ antiporter, TMEM165/GDT1 family
LFELSLAAFTAAFALVVLAEMGDKTQFVAMAFAAKYNAYKVLFAIFLGTIANFVIVIALGEALSAVVPLEAISLAASLAFIGFGLWTLRDEKTDEEKVKLSRFGVVATVATTFFVAEMGDKTQLATLSLAVQYQSPASVLVGAVLAMLVADSIGIVVGVVFCRRIPQRALKWLSAIIFVVFGLVGVFEFLVSRLSLAETAVIMGALSVATAAAMVAISRRRNKKSKPSP